MGGIGSGRHNYGRPTVESSHHIDVRWLKKYGKLDYPNSGSLSWSRNGQKTGAISYSINDERILLSYRHKYPNSSEWEQVQQSIHITTTECNYGGKRKWFLCPKCSKRVAIVYSYSKYFYCRNCLSLPYRSTLESDRDRIFTKKHELGEQIFQYYERGEGFFKKKGMHQKTFDHKLRKYKELERQTLMEIERYLDILKDNDS